MKRRLFLQFPLVASALITSPAIQQNGRAKKGIKVDAGKDRFLEELLIMGGRFDCKVSGKDSNGDLCIYDTVRMDKGGPALHLHHNQDEWFYIISGEFLVRVGEDLFTMKAGDTAFAPRKIPHAFAKTSEGPGQLLILFQPAGSMEDYFLQVSKIGSDIPQNQEKALKELIISHGMELVGPPLKF